MKMQYSPNLHGRLMHILMCSKCVRFRVPAKPLRFEHSGAHKDLSLPRSLSQQSQGLAQRIQRTRDRRVYTGSGHRCGVIPYSSVVWWIASWAEDEQLQGKNSLLRRGVLVLGELGWLRMI